jgi:hypothetical protein
MYPTSGTSTFTICLEHRYRLPALWTSFLAPALRLLLSGTEAFRVFSPRAWHFGRGSCVLPVWYRLSMSGTRLNFYTRIIHDLGSGSPRSWLLSLDSGAQSSSEYLGAVVSSSFSQSRLHMTRWMWLYRCSMLMHWIRMNTTTDRMLRAKDVHSAERISCLGSFLQSNRLRVCQWGQ